MNEELEEQASLYALDLLEPEQIAPFEAQMARDPELRARVDDLRETAAQYAHAASLRRPPAHLESQILAAIKADAPAAVPRATSATAWIPWALAATLAIACVVLLADRMQTKKELARLEQRNAFAQMQIATLASQLESAPNASAAVVWDGEMQEGVLKVSDVPANAADRDYQLWIVDPDYPQPVDAGTFHVATPGTTNVPFKPKAPIKSASAFAVSLERKGGVPKAEGPMVLVGK